MVRNNIDAEDWRFFGIHRLSAEDRTKSDPVNPAMQLVDARWLFDAEIRETLLWRKTAVHGVGR